MGRDYTQTQTSGMGLLDNQPLAGNQESGMSEL